VKFLPSSPVSARFQGVHPLPAPGRDDALNRAEESWPLHSLQRSPAPPCLADGGSLNGETRKNLAAFRADRQAREDMELYRSMPGEREWWRLAYAADGRLAGLAMPNCNPHGPVVGYLGVVPELGGHRYIDDILAEITRFHAARSAHRITDATDRTNLPMAAAFERAGYRNYAVRLVLSAPAARDAALPDRCRWPSATRTQALVAASAARLSNATPAASRTPAEEITGRFMLPMPARAAR
jgi:hypothetical protein